MIEADDTKTGAGAAPATAQEDGGAPTPGEARAAASEACVVAGEARAAQGEAAHDAALIEPLVLQRGAKIDGKEQYHVEELLQYHDALFIESAYRALTGRAPFASERARALDDLRGGRASKVEIVERLLSSPEAARRGVRVEGLPSPLMRRLSRVPVVGYVLRLARALVRLPLLMEHQQRFETYALAQQQLIADHVNQGFALVRQADADAAAPAAVAGGDTPGGQVFNSSQYDELVETVTMFSDALLDLSNGHAELQAQLETQAEQVQEALAELTGALTAQQQITETLRRERQTLADAQQEFLIQEQRVIVETQKVVLEELREELRAVAQRQDDARAQLEARVRRLQTLLDEAAEATARRNFSGT